MTNQSPAPVVGADRLVFKVEPGSREHFWLLMAPYHLQSVTGKDAEHLQAFARDVWLAALHTQSAPAVAVEALPRDVLEALEWLDRLCEPGWYTDRLGPLNDWIKAHPLAAGSAPAVAESQWMPIESAPKDGTHILAMLPDSETCHIICWVDASKGIRVGCGMYGWHVAWDGHPCAGYSAPTHWMPLPTLPTVGSGSAQEGQAR